MMLILEEDWVILFVLRTHKIGKHLDVTTILLIPWIYAHQNKVDEYNQQDMTTIQALHIHFFVKLKMIKA